MHTTANQSSTTSPVADAVARWEAARAARRAAELVLHHDLDEAAHPETELAFEALAVRSAPTVTPECIAAYQSVLDARAAAWRIQYAA